MKNWRENKMGGLGGVIFYGIEITGGDDFADTVEDMDKVRLYHPYSGYGGGKTYAIYKASRKTQDELDKENQYIIPNAATFMGEVNMDAEIHAFIKKNKLESIGGFHWFFVADEIF